MNALFFPFLPALTFLTKYERMCSHRGQERGLYLGRRTTLAIYGLNNLEKVL